LNWRIRQATLDSACRRWAEVGDDLRETGDKADMVEPLGCVLAGQRAILRRNAEVTSETLPARRVGSDKAGLLRDRHDVIDLRQGPGLDIDPGAEIGPSDGTRAIPALPEERQGAGLVLHVGDNSSLDGHRGLQQSACGRCERRQITRQHLQPGKVSGEREAARLSKPRQLHPAKVEGERPGLGDEFHRVKLVEEFGTVSVVSRGRPVRTR
jgi:hypothetical protein